MHVLQDIEAEADRMYADDLSEIDRMLSENPMQICNPDLDFDFTSDDFHFDANRERSR